MIQFEGVSRSYGDTLAVRHLDLQIESGELFALLGHNGAGKTTTIKMMVGLLRPEAGRVLIDGRDVVTQVREATSRIGYVPDEPYLYDKLSGREFLYFVAEMHGLSRKDATVAIDREIERFGLGRFADELSESYSHGMKQRTVFAAALLHDPPVLVVDEPLVGLDPHSIRLVKDLLHERAQSGTSIFMSTHTLTAAEEIADRIGVMQRGELIFLGTIDELRHEYHAEGKSLESVYLSISGGAVGGATVDEVAQEEAVAHPTASDESP
ncbi:SkfA peptide export ATP-binding protein SkfE [Botrimarina colliarenosi]|uniref:SkfA peptide export ATP-binding protein SkfE n=1 Tax=Botrimarina colliarenosi TaxID=2528001 RepID=A0A5C6AG54_9BACT|nr:ABC transporter ATP-binding protein [Botrimarina colliarenosi]TWT98041.1 SkfA peptide export ATP-binding protein SkfE [Botrimarina colliarenosi]